MTNQVFPKPSDQIYPTYSKIKRQINQVECLPTWEEILEYEHVRQEGKYNMFEAGNVMRYAFDSGLYNLVNWLQRCKELKQSYTHLYTVALGHYETLYGSRDTWVTNKSSKKIKLTLLENEERRLQDELNVIRMKRLDLVESL